MTFPFYIAYQCFLVAEGDMPGAEVAFRPAIAAKPGSVELGTRVDMHTI